MLAAKHCSMLFPSAKTDCFLLCTEGNVKQTNLLMDLDCYRSRDVQKLHARQVTTGRSVRISSPGKSLEVKIWNEVMNTENSFLKMTDYFMYALLKVIQVGTEVQCARLHK